MKRLFVVTLLTLMLLAPLALTAQTTLFKFNQDGEFASLSQSPDPSSSFSLNVSRNFSTGAGTSASISYLAFSFAADNSTLTITQIVGRFPPPTSQGRTRKI